MKLARPPPNTHSLARLGPPPIILPVLITEVHPMVAPSIDPMIPHAHVLRHAVRRELVVVRLVRVAQEGVHERRARRDALHALGLHEALEEVERGVDVARVGFGVGVWGGEVRRGRARGRDGGGVAGGGGRRGCAGVWGRVLGGERDGGEQRRARVGPAGGVVRPKMRVGVGRTACSITLCFKVKSDQSKIKSK